MQIPRRISRGYNENPRQGNIFLNYLTACSLRAEMQENNVDLFKYDFTHKVISSRTRYVFNYIHIVADICLQIVTWSLQSNPV